MEPVKPKISVEYADNAAIVTFIDEKILEEKDVQTLQTAIMPVVESLSAGTILVLDFRNVRFLSSAVLGLLIRLSKKVLRNF